ncbi:MAG: arsenite methyltransferase [Asgard group archaeon]|nr:arsenite methyltransferase [Asgard group archaeon]
MVDKILETKSCCSTEDSNAFSESDNEKEKARREIRERYTNLAEGKISEVSKAEKETTEAAASSHPLYSKEELQSIPKDSNLGLGSGNPVSHANLQLGETVVDLGSGAGVDCFLASKIVGETGKIIGIDMTPKMIDLARDNAYKGNYENVEFRLGEIEHLPIADSTVDVIISNCVINLASSKKQVFKEAFRVLKPGGRLIISDIMFENELPEKVRSIFKDQSGCVSRAILKNNYLETIREVGFTKAEIIDQYTIKPQNKPEAKSKSKGLSKITLISGGKKAEVELDPQELQQLETAIISAHVRAIKPY